MQGKIKTEQISGIVKNRGEIPIYTGEYAVTPSDNEIKLYTSGLRMTNDVTVKGVPDIQQISADVDDALSDVSENPVQNKAVKAALDGIEEKADANAENISDLRENKADKSEIPDISGLAEQTGLDALGERVAALEENIAGLQGGKAEVTDVAGLARRTSTAEEDIEALKVSKADASALDGKVDKAEGKGLSANDYTNAEKSKLSGISEGATSDFPDGRSLSRSAEGVWSANYANENLLINSNFMICQRQISYNTPIYPVAEEGRYIYNIVDRWRVVNGYVKIILPTAIELHGTITQKLERAAGSDVTASAGNNNGVIEGIAEYRDNGDGTGTFSITGDNVVITWAKLEHGRKRTPYATPNHSEEYLKCCRYFYRAVGYGSSYIVDIPAATMILPVNVKYPALMCRLPATHILDAYGGYDKAFVWIDTGTIPGVVKVSDTTRGSGGFGIITNTEFFPTGTIGFGVEADAELY